MIYTGVFIQTIGLQPNRKTNFKRIPCLAYPAAHSLIRRLCCVNSIGTVGLPHSCGRFFFAKIRTHDFFAKAAAICFSANSSCYSDCFTAGLSNMELRRGYSATAKHSIPSAKGFRKDGSGRQAHQINREIGCHARQYFLVSTKTGGNFKNCVC